MMFSVDFGVWERNSWDLLPPYDVVAPTKESAMEAASNLLWALKEAKEASESTEIVQLWETDDKGDWDYLVWDWLDGGRWIEKE